MKSSEKLQDRHFFVRQIMMSGLKKHRFSGLFTSIFGWERLAFSFLKGVLRFYFSSIRTTSKLFACNDFCNLTSILDRITLPSDHQREAFACSI